MTNILGISAFYHDSAAALLQDGDLVAAAQEERFTRIKGDANYPKFAVSYCLTEGGITPADLDYVVFYEHPYVKFERLIETAVRVAPHGYQPFAEAMPLWSAHRLHIPRVILTELGPDFKGQLCVANHHESHAASAFFPSPFEDAAILTLDAVGEWATSSLGVGKGRTLELTHELRFPHSLGMLYSAFTYYAGFKVNSGEYKLMGLAPYGQPKYVDLILRDLIRLHEDGSLWMNMQYFNYCRGLTMTSEQFHQLLGGSPRKPEETIREKDMDLAASIQVVCEEVVLRVANFAFATTQLPNLVMAGGVALNCVANGRLKREGPFRNIWVQPAAGDAGGALGAALLGWHHFLAKPRKITKPDAQKGSLLGPRFQGERVRLALDAFSATYEDIQDEDELLSRVAGLLNEEKIIGWFHGRMEFGPRALGCRSIIGDPRSMRMQQIMNVKIKFRESFRPFAPCVLKEWAHKIFQMEPGEDSPYMLHVAPVREEWRTELSEQDRRRMQDPDLRVRVAVPRSAYPAITHVDYSARIQTVDERHGRFFRLMTKFFELAGCPIVVNTSFNIRGEPLVCNPEDAYKCFMATDMDVLVVENCLLLKENQPAGLVPGLEWYRDQNPLD
jgi:carbamoyltransferase